MVRSLAVLSALVAFTAFAEPARISIVNFKGAKSAEVKDQLSESLCSSFTCVEPGSGEDVEVDAVVTGQVKGGKLALSVYYDEDARPVKKSLKLAKGKLKKPDLAQAAKAVRVAAAHASRMASAD